MANTTHGGIAAQAAAYLARSGNNIPLSRGDPSEIHRQFQTLQEWAALNSCLIDEYIPPQEAKHSGGAEHDVFFDPELNRVVKRTKPGKAGSVFTKYGLRLTATPYFYLRRIELTNLYFESDIHLIAVTRGENPSIITSHEWAHPHDANGAGAFVGGNSRFYDSTRI